MRGVRGQLLYLLEYEKKTYLIGSICQPVTYRYESSFIIAYSKVEILSILCVNAD